MVGKKTSKLVSVPREYEAELIGVALRDCGIESEVVGGHTSDFRADCPGLVDVIVDQTDLVVATKILDELKESAEEIDWDNVDVGESEYSADQTDDSNSDGHSLPSRSFIVTTTVALGILYLITTVGMRLLGP